MDSVKYWVALNMVLGIGKTLFHRLVREIGPPERVFRASRAELMRIDGIGEKTADQILKFDVEQISDRELRLAEKLGARILTSAGPDYPELLKSIYDPPPVLYYMGKGPALFPAPLAVVGTRMPTNYGRLVAERLAASLAEMGFCIVSGMARGIDTIAHKSAIKAGGDTLAVFGCGLSHTYPPENAALRKKISEHGAVVSEFPIMEKPDRNNFPARNRVISGLSAGTVIVEADEKSGALITAHFALEQGREVFAVPGDIYSPKSRGTNRLIKMGAKLVDGPESVAEELAPSIQAALKELRPRSLDKSGMSPKERKLFSLLSSEEKHIDSLIENSQLSPAEVSATLVQLELKGLVRQRDGKMFIANHV
ncbi:MAG: DNA-protecting protein DprA [Nitrospinae bacterium]|nr:DNA-protecting protein DprA [Nitrospinota bacterium]